MSGWSQLGTFFDFCAMYLTLQFERCAVLSLVWIGVVLLLRKTFFARGIFTRGILWSFFLIIPCLGRMKIFYENPFVLGLTWRLTGITMHHLWVGRIYMAGVLISFFYILGKRLRLRRIVSRMDRRIAAGREIRVTAMNITPFTIGLIRPEIVLPEIMVCNYGDDELEVIVQHELTHSRLGHLWCYLAWDILRCLLWVNPLLSVCQKYFLADLEDMCDRVCIQKGRREAYEYGEVLLKSLKLLRSQEDNISSAVTYAGEKEFEEIRRRISNIASFRPYQRMSCICAAAMTMAVIAGLFWGIHSVSYARYQELDSMLVYEYEGGKGTLLSADSDALHKMIHYDEDFAYVDRVEFEKFLHEKGAEGEIFIVFGGFQKLPGLGAGGGYSCQYERDSEDKVVRIPYEKPEENWMTVLIKLI